MLLPYPFLGNVAERKLKLGDFETATYGPLGFVSSAFDFEGLTLNWTPFLFVSGELCAKLLVSCTFGGGSGFAGNVAALHVGSLNLKQSYIIFSILFYRPLRI